MNAIMSDILVILGMCGTAFILYLIITRVLYAWFGDKGGDI